MGVSVGAGVSVGVGVVGGWDSSSAICWGRESEFKSGHNSYNIGC